MAAVKLGKVFGIAVELHPTFVWLVVALAVFQLVIDPTTFVPSMMLLVFLFVSVFVHELFHSLVAISKKCRVEKIVLMPIGGVSITEEMPEKPLDEFLVAIAGPLFNFLVVFLVLAVVTLFPGLPWPHNLFNGAMNPDLVEQALLDYPLFALMWVNLVLGAFNLFVPALPMDGGRVLRAILAAVMGHAKATALATRISMGFAILMGLLGLLGGNFMLAIIAVFIYFGAVYERDSNAMKETLKGTDYRDALIKKAPVLDAGTPFSEALKAFEEKNLDWVLVTGGNVPGYLAVDELLALDKSKRLGGATVGQLAKPLPVFVEGTPAEKLMAFFASKGFPVAGIAKDGKLAGIVSQESLDRLYQVTKLKKKFDLQY